MKEEPFSFILFTLGGHMKLIAIDMDGTLLNSANHVSNQQLTFLEKLDTEKDFHLVVTTGRPVKGVINTLPEEIRQKLYIIGLNGSIIVDPKLEIMKSHSLSLLEFREVQEFAEAVKVDVSVLDSKGFYTTAEKTTELMKHDAGLNKMEMELIKKKDVENLDVIAKVLLFFPPERMEEIIDAIPQQFFNQFSVIFSQPYLIEFLPKGIDKGSSILSLANHFKIDEEDIVAIGDGLNDLSMLNIAGVSIGMKNSVPEVLSNVDYVTLSNDEDGVQYAIENFVKKND